MKCYRQCPVCSSRNGMLLHTIKYPAEPDRILPVEYRIMSCSECGMVFDDFDADESVFARHYQSDGKYEMEVSSGAGGTSERDRLRWEKIASFLMPYLPDPAAAIVDIGAGKGGLLRYLLGEGYTDLTAVDASPNCIRYIREHSGIHAVCSDLNQLALDRKFDAVIFAQTLEHIYCCVESLAKIRELLSDDGILYLEVPDAGRYLEYQKMPFYYFDHEHINHFQRTSLETLLQRNGFEIISISQFEIENSPGFFTPHLAAAARKNRAVQPGKTGKNDFRPLQKYVEESMLRDESLFHYDCGEKTGYLWGVGAFCLRLLEKGTFSNLDLAGLIDRDPKKQGTEIQGLVIYSPEVLLRSDPEKTFVLITTSLYEDEIRKQLQEMGYSGEIVTLS